MLEACKNDTNTPGKNYGIKTLRWCSCWFGLVWLGWVWFYGISTIFSYLMPNPFFTYISNIWFVNAFCRNTQLTDQTVLFLTIQFSISQQSWMVSSIAMYNSHKHQSFVYTQLNDLTVLFLTIQFSMSFICTQFKCQTFLVDPIIGRTLSSATTSGQWGSGNKGNEEVLSIPQSSCITGASPSDCLVSYLGHSLRGLIPL